MVKRAARRCLPGLLACCAALTYGCSDADETDADDAASPSWFDDPLRDFPEQLPPLPPAAIVYEPAYPLWSDGGMKTRAVLLPEGATIDASNADAYAFPIGTLIVKTFAYRTPASPERERAVETRLLRHREAGWDYAAYAWDEAGEVAERLDLRRPEPRTVLGEDGAELEHVIPNRLECQQCHESADSIVLGLNELQLTAGKGVGEALAARFEPALEPPYRALPEAGPLTLAVLGYLVGNCVHCHNGSNGATSSFDLRPDVALANLIEQPTESSASADGIRVVPGNPEQSVLFLGLRGAGELEVKDMPPLAVAERDRRAIELFRSWILALKDETQP